MAGLKLNHIYKVYPNGAKAVNDFSMEIDDKEFIVFVGPSGCGKSTTLRMIAGLEEITAGELTMEGELLNDMESKDRDVAMVFQNYALYPHMTVYQNMAFGLKLRKVPKEEIDRKIKEAAQILGITEYLNRKPAAMSGGQRQRVALGRAMVREPKVFLLDEPLSNLDAKLRTQMRSEISKLHHKLQTTFIYVTHDQVEAMTMGTRIVVMKDGFVQQVDTPRNLYKYPCNKFVAGFIGTPQMNFYNGRLLLKGDKVRVTFDNTPVEVECPAEFFDKTDREFLGGEKAVVLGLRSEHISVDPDAYPYKAKCRVSHVEELGTESLVFGDFNPDSEDTVTESPTRVIVKAPAGADYGIGDIIEVSLGLSSLHAFDAETENSIIPRIPEKTAVKAVVAGGKLKMLGAEIVLPPAMTVPDGEYTAEIPYSALAFGGNIRVKVTDTETVNGVRLLRVKAGENVLFLTDGETDLTAVTGVSVDLKRVILKNAQTVLEAVPLFNSAEGVMSKKKIAVEEEENGKVKKRRKTAYSFEILGCPFECEEAKALRVVSGGGSRIYGKPLTFTFSPYQIKPAEEGIEAVVERILDYGAERFAKCKAGENVLYVYVGADFAGESVKLAVDTESVVVTEVERGIRLA